MYLYCEQLCVSDELIQAFKGDQGNDTLEKIDNIWAEQQKHVACIQDPAGVSLYIQTGTQKKGGVVLPKFRCARGSTSLESFHNHLARFIPGNYKRKSKHLSVN